MSPIKLSNNIKELLSVLNPPFGCFFQKVYDVLSRSDLAQVSLAEQIESTIVPYPRQRLYELVGILSVDLILPVYSGDQDDLLLHGAESTCILLLSKPLRWAVQYRSC